MVRESLSEEVTSKQKFKICLREKNRGLRCLKKKNRGYYVGAQRYEGESMMMTVGRGEQGQVVEGSGVL